MTPKPKSVKASASGPLTDVELADVTARFASGEYDYLSLETAGRLFATISALQDRLGEQTPVEVPKYSTNPAIDADLRRRIDDE